MRTITSIVLIAFTMTSCAASVPDEVLIHPQAEDIEQRTFNPTSKQISYRVQMEYPKPAVSEAAFERLAELGWTRCTATGEGWDSYVDASAPKGGETVFQNMTYWKRGETLMTVVMRYYSKVGIDRQKVDRPDNLDQYVVVLEDRNPGTEDWLRIKCS